MNVNCLDICRESLSSLVDEDTATICMAMQENNKDTAYLASLDGNVERV